MNKATADHPMRLLIIRNVTLETIAPLLRAEASKRQIPLEIRFSGFDSAVQEVLSGVFNDYAPHLCLFHFSKLASLPRLCNAFPRLTDAEIESEIDGFLTQITTVLSGLANTNYRPSVLLHLVEQFTYPLQRYSKDNYSCQNAIIERVRTEIIALTENYPNITLIDNDAVLRRLGEEQFYDRRYWYFGRAPYARMAMEHFARLTLQHIDVVTGRRKKCLVLDCDNTLWGGIIGEDGISGIALGGTGKGGAYLDIQNHIANLAATGILIALCSKNNEEDVWQVFDHHRDMVLRREHICAHRINWNSKVDNLLELAIELNIGLDSMVFVDDSNFEIEHIVSALPQTDVMRLDPANPSSFLPALQNSGWFAATEVLNEDRNRTISYQQQQQRQSLRSELSLHDYLKSLETVATLREATAVDLPRVSQMSQKTNQFNLTTERLTDGDIDSALEAGEHFFVLELCDRYGDLGIVGYAHLRTDAERKHGELCNFALSCRALGREVEDLFLFALLDHWQLSLKRIDARWRRSGKNQQTKHFYERCGFCFLHHSETERHYSLELGSTMLPPRPSSITLIDQLEPLNGN